MDRIPKADQSTVEQLRDVAVGRADLSWQALETLLNDGSAAVLALENRRIRTERAMRASLRDSPLPGERAAELESLSRQYVELREELAELRDLLERARQRGSGRRFAR